MITAVDTSVLLDVLTDDARFGSVSLAALEQAQRAGSLVMCPIVRAELRGRFGDSQSLDHALDAAVIVFDPITPLVADRAGAIWAAYRRAGGNREHMVPDFLIGAHALERSDRLLTRDRGFYRAYFQSLTVLDPTAATH